VGQLALVVSSETPAHRGSKVLQVIQDFQDQMGLLVQPALEVQAAKLVNQAKQEQQVSQVLKVQLEILDSQDLKV